MKQTAIEWYSDKLVEILGDNANLFTIEQTLANHYALKQAKEMEKQQIIEAYDKGEFNQGCNEDAAQYYYQTYKPK